MVSVYAMGIGIYYISLTLGNPNGWHFDPHDCSRCVESECSNGIFNENSPDYVVISVGHTLFTGHNCFVYIILLLCSVQKAVF